jgi:hypothetical protein
MSRPEVTFSNGALDLAPPDRDRIESAVRRIPDDGVSPGCWPYPVGLVEVTKVFNNGRSGGAVVGALVHNEEIRSYVVIKVDQVDVLRDEWEAFKLIDSRRTMVFAPVHAATPAVASDGRGQGEREAIVYGDVGQYAGTPGAEVRSLEEVVAEAHRISGLVDAAVGLIEQALARMRPGLHDNCNLPRVPSSLRELNRDLGPSLELRVDTDADDVAAPITDSAVFRRSLTGEAGDLQVGERILLQNVRVVGPSTLEANDIRISVTGTLDPSATSVRGTITGVRGGQRRAALGKALNLDTTTVGPWRVGNTIIADPFGALVHVFTTCSPRRPQSRVHGDLNARNILVTGNHPFLIDYAHVKNNRPQQGDFGWLEMSLLRDVFANMGFASLVRLQRVLALGGRLLCLGAVAGDVEGHCLPMLTGVETGAFRMLFAVRRAAHACYLTDAEPEWSRDHLAHLVIAAHRTLKFPAEAQSDAKLAAVAVAAGVATEWLVNEDPFELWDDQQSCDAKNLLRSQLVQAASMTPAKTFPDHPLLAFDGFLDPPAEEDPSEAVPWPADLAVPDSPAVRATATNLVREHTAAAIVGPKESGKSTVLRAICRNVAEEARKGGGHIPVLITAENIAVDQVSPCYATILNDASGKNVAALESLVLGALHLFVDDLHLLDDGAAQDVTAWLSQLHRRFPLTRITVCCRETGSVPDGFTSIRLLDLDQRAVTAYLLKQVTSYGKVEDLLSRRLDDPLWAAVNLGRFGPLSRLARYLRHNDLPESPHELHDAMFRAQLGDDPVAAQVAEDLAAQVLTSGKTMVPAPADVSALVNAGILREAGGHVLFAEQHALDYFAARKLVRDTSQDPATVLDHALTPLWHNAFGVFAALPGAPDESVALLVDELSSQDPVLAGRVLGGSRTRPRECANLFVADQLAILRNPALATRERTRASVALLEYGDPRPLASFAGDPGNPEESRRLALWQLARLAEREPAGAVRDDVARALTRSVLRVLREDSSPALVGSALQAVRRGRIERLELHVAEFVDETQPWPVVHEAMTVLKVLRTVLTPGLVSRYLVCCDQRLEEIGDSLRTRTSALEVRELQLERVHLLKMLPRRHMRARLLRLRFAFEIGGDVADLLDEVAPSVPDPASSVLSGPDRPDQWLVLAAKGTPAVAAAAAHRLLRDAPDRSGELLAALGGSTSGDRLLIAAAATGPGEAEAAEHLFRAALPVAGPDEFEGLSALLCAIFAADRSRGVRLTWTAARTFVERNLSERWYWPWRAAVARCGGTPADHDALLCGDDESVRLAIEALASRRPSPRWGGHRFSEVAIEHLVRACPPPDAAPVEVVDWAWAIATAHPEGAEALLNPLLDRPGLLDATIARMSSRGLIHSSAHELVVDALRGLDGVTAQPNLQPTP